RLLGRAPDDRRGRAHAARGRRQPAATPGGRRQARGVTDPPGVSRTTHVIRWLAVVVVLSVAAAAAAIALGLRQPGPPRTGPAIVTVEEGERFADIADDLRRQGVLRHPLPLVLWARFTRRDRAVHWGEFLITTPLSPLELLARVTGPPDPLHPLTVPEGFTVREIVRLLAAGGFGA